MSKDLNDFLKSKEMEIHKLEEEKNKIEEIYNQADKSSLKHWENLFDIVWEKHNKKLSISLDTKFINNNLDKIEKNSNKFNLAIYYTFYVKYLVEDKYYPLTWDHSTNIDYEVWTSSHGETSRPRYGTYKRKCFIINAAGFHTILQQRYRAFDGDFTIVKSNEWTYAMIASHGNAAEFLPIFEERLLEQMRASKAPYNPYDTNYWT